MARTLNLMAEHNVQTLPNLPDEAKVKLKAIQDAAPQQKALHHPSAAENALAQQKEGDFKKALKEAPKLTPVERAALKDAIYFKEATP